MTIYLFRHAESIDNRCHVFSGWRNVDLSDKGIIDCQELAELLKDKEFSTIFTPNLMRNVKTVKEILKYHPDAEIVYDDRIKERCYGELQGTQHLKLMQEDMPAYLNYHRSYDVPPPDGESIADVEKRVLPFCDELVACAKKTGQNVAVCAGNNAMRVIRRKFENLTIPQMLKIENPYDNYFEYSV